MVSNFGLFFCFCVCSPYIFLVKMGESEISTIFENMCLLKSVVNTVMNFVCKQVAFLRPRVSVFQCPQRYNDYVYLHYFSSLEVFYSFTKLLSKLLTK